MNLILIGLRGSGKTTLGRLVAAQFARPFVDLDAVVPGLMGCATVAEAFRTGGEPAFRAAEFRALSAVLKQDNQVIALGGGTPTAPGAAELLRAECAAARATIVYLEASAAELRSRLETTNLASRPSLTGADPLVEIDAVLTRRDGLYRELADQVIETGGLSVDEVARRIIETTGREA